MNTGGETELKPVGLFERLRRFIRRVWRGWRDGRRSYAAALSASVILPFGILYSGGIATAIIACAWITFVLIGGAAVVDTTTGGEGGLTVIALASGLVVCALHIIVPVIAVALHNARVAKRKRDLDSH